MHSIDGIQRSKILIPGPLRERRGELGALAKFRDIPSIKEIIAKYGCFLKKCKNDETNDIELYQITEAISDPIFLDQILAAAVPINILSKPGFILAGAQIIEKCLEHRVPIFIITPKDCSVYQIWKCNNGNIEFECPKKRTGINFQCKANHSQFCKWIEIDDNKLMIGEILSKFKQYTGNPVIPLFEFSSFINYCISAHYFQVWDTYIRDLHVKKEHFKNAFKASMAHEVGSASPDVVKNGLSVLR